MLETAYIVQVILTDASGPTSSREEVLRDIVDGIAALAGRRRCAVARQVHRSGISLGHLQILWILQEHGPLPVSRLADWLGIGAPNATGLLDRMEQRGLVVRERDADDRRVVLTRMTDAGRAAVAEHDGWKAELIEQLLAPLPMEQLVAVAAGIRRTCREADRALAAEGPADRPAAGPADGHAVTHAAPDPASPGGGLPAGGVPQR